MKIVIVEDNKDLSALIKENLDKVGIASEAAFDGDQALELINPDIHDLIILDRGLPDMDGIELLKILREEGIKTPVLILTAMDELGDKVAGLNSGADDYLVKPFETEELIARIRALYRRPSDVVGMSFQIGNIELIPEENALKVDGTQVELTVKEKEALERLMRLPGKVIGKDALQTSLYGYGDEGSRNSVEVLIHRIRKKLEDAGADAEIRTLRGIGYLIKKQEG